MMKWIREKILTWQFKFIAPTTILLIIILVASCDIVSSKEVQNSAGKIGLFLFLCDGSS